MTRLAESRIEQDDVAAGINERRGKAVDELIGRQKVVCEKRADGLGRLEAREPSFTTRTSKLPSLNL
jgi:hypothetical protein